jgi:hypothetical protein
MAIADPQTTITVRQSTRQLLESVKATGQTYDELLRDLVEEHYPSDLIRELKRRMARRPEGRMDSEVFRGPRK